MKNLTSSAFARVRSFVLATFAALLVTLAFAAPVAAQNRQLGDDDYTPEVGETITIPDLPLHPAIFIAGVAIGYLVGFVVGKGKRPVVPRGAGMALLIIGLSAAPAFAQVAGIPSFDPPGTTQVAPPAPAPQAAPTPAPTTQVAPAPAPAPAVEMMPKSEHDDIVNDMDRVNNQLQRELNDAKTDRNGLIMIWAVATFVVGFGLGWFIWGRETHGHDHHAGGHGPDDHGRDDHRPETVRPAVPAAHPDLGPDWEHGRPAAPAAGEARIVRTAGAPESAAVPHPAPVVVPPIPAAPAAATVTATATVEPAAPAATDTTGTARVITMIALAIGLSAATAFAQVPTAPITGVSPQRLETGKTTKVTVTCSAACVPTDVKIGMGNPSGIVARNINPAGNGFSMDVEVSPVKTSDITRWVILVGGSTLVAPEDKSFWVMSNQLVSYVDGQINARMRNVSATDQTARRQITALTTTVNNLGPRIKQEVVQETATSLAEANRQIATLRKDLNDLIEVVEGVRVQTNRNTSNVGDLSTRQSSTEETVADTRKLAEVTAETLLNVKIGRFQNGPIVKKDSDERTAVQAVLDELRAKRQKN
jgi:hypothetical protein